MQYQKTPNNFKNIQNIFAFFTGEDESGSQINNQN